MTEHVTRLAPSPTGALHLGNARTFVLNYLLARTRDWRVLMRMEDLDGPRTKAGAVDEAVTDLRWLGLEWDHRVADQSQRTETYRSALARLVDAGVAYPCTCSRTDVRRAASAPHRSDGEVVYPGTCRRRWADADQALRETGKPPAFRVSVEADPIEFDDGFAGRQRFDLTETCGDFVIFKSDGGAGYQLAVVLDDEAAGVTQVVRGDDLLESTARQLRLHRLLGLERTPAYWHPPLVVGPEGRRLAKRHGDTRLSHYRDLGVPVERVLGLIGFWSGMSNRREPVSLDELMTAFDPADVPREPVVMTAEDEAFLRA